MTAPLEEPETRRTFLPIAYLQENGISTTNGPLSESIDSLTPSLRLPTLDRP